MDPTTTALYSGNQTKWHALVAPCLPRLMRFAQRRLPVAIQGAIGPDDLVQEAVMSGIRQLHRFEFRHKHAFLVYLLTSIRHRIVDELRRAQRGPTHIPLTGHDPVDPAPSPFQHLIAQENMRRYATALARLGRRDRQLIVLRLERGLPYLEVAAVLGMRTEAAVRMAVRRALHRLEQALNETTRPIGGGL